MPGRITTKNPKVAGDGTSTTTTDTPDEETSKSTSRHLLPKAKNVCQSELCPCNMEPFRDSRRSKEITKPTHKFGPNVNTKDVVISTHSAFKFESNDKEMERLFGGMFVIDTYSLTHSLTHHSPHTPTFFARHLQNRQGYWIKKMLRLRRMEKFQQKSRALSNAGDCIQGSGHGL